MRLLPLIAAFALSLSTFSCQELSFADKHSSASARAVLAAGDSLREGKTMDQDAWERLFETDGYAKYLASNRSGALRAMIQEAVLVAFSPDRHAEADSLLRLTPDANDYQALMSKNFCELAARQEDAVRFLTETDFPALLDRANRLVKEHLPRRVSFGKVPLNDLHLICTIPDASVRDHSVLLDLNLAMDMTEDEIVRMLAHEFFHNYREVAVPHWLTDPFWKIFNSFEDEGCADLIDKGDHPETMYARVGASFEALFLDEYQNASRTLQKLDSLLVIYRTDPAEGSYAPVDDLLLFNGHPTGYHMTRLIREAGLEGELIQVFDRPACFAELYNKAAAWKNARGGDEYVLSEEMLDYLYAVEE